MGKILVTGGTGYIGSHTTVELIQAGFKVVIVDNLFNSVIETLDGIKEITGVKPDFEKFDLCDYDRLKEFFKKYPDIDSIVHFAAHKAVGESVRDPLKYYHNNLVSLINLLKIATKKNIKNFVFSSSCTVYGEPEELPVTEETPTKGQASPYGNTKSISEEILRDVAKTHDINVISLRYFNPVGAHDSILIGELPLGKPENLVPYITQTAAGIRKELKIFGNDYDTPDGYNIRDYIHIVDLAKAHVVALKRLLEKKNKLEFEIYNLGTGKGSSTMEVVKTFEKATGQKLNYRIVGRRPGDVVAVYTDASLAEEELGWKAQRTLEDMLKSAWEWEKKYRNIQ
ncbi:UDP-glucose 4-epimerase GalE [Candidatus Falkowbacteria bacterium]|nr:MAG: UDP-glucose 4-epimerase GalE [Candidatus Falkowbacteria bacterium]